VKKFKYNTNQINFLNLLESAFNVEDLERIHEELEVSYLAPEGEAGLGNDTDSVFHKIFYKKLNSGWLEFTECYKKFITDIIMPIMKVDKIIYQKKPSFRIQYPNSKAVTTWHYDSDELHRHPDWEINVQVALTEMKNETSTWIESVPGLRDFSPMNMTPGEFWIFNGNKCLHGNKPNTTDKTRISFDFRVIPFDRYNPKSENFSATTKQGFIVGEYYDIITREQDV
tara:strand:- start:19 stop:699 length:681 start_codon:yes stop_codon:yes gene_type:complete